MGIKTGIGLSAIALTLAACGSSANPEPVEQIIVREIGAEATPAADAGPADASEDLVAVGRSAFAVCASCHSVDADGPSRLGPNLFDVMGREAGTREGFAYSDALQSSGIVWTEGDLDAFLAAPMDVVPGTTMAAGKVSAPERRAAIIAYLSSLGDES